MKLVYVIGALLLTTQMSMAQIGINTENFLSGTTFQVDPLKNTASLGAGVADDMVVSLDTDDVALGLGAKAPSDAQLYLSSENKALKMNEVALLSLTDIVTVPNPRSGMVVYNTTNIASEDVEIGWCYFDGVKWNRVLEAYLPPNIKNEFTTPYHDVDDITIPPMSYANATAGAYADALKIDFQNSSTSQIKAPEDGTYVFALRFYSYSTIPYNGLLPLLYDNQEVLYLFCVSKTKNKVLDKTILTFPYTQRMRGFYSYRLVMGMTLDKNEEVEFYVARGTTPDFDDCPLALRVLDSSTNLDLKSAARTSLVFWKL